MIFLLLLTTNEFPAKNRLTTIYQVKKGQKKNFFLLILRKFEKEFYQKPERYILALKLLMSHSMGRKDIV